MYILGQLRRTAPLKCSFFSRLVTWLHSSLVLNQCLNGLPLVDDFMKSTLRKSNLTVWYLKFCFYISSEFPRTQFRILPVRPPRLWLTGHTQDPPPVGRKGDAAADAVAKALQSRPTARPHRRQPTGLLHPWDFPGKSTGVGGRCLLQGRHCWLVSGQGRARLRTLSISSSKKGPPADAGDVGLIPGSGRFPGGGNGSPLQHSGLENPMDRGAWWATVRGVAKSQARLSGWAHTCPHP